MKNLLLSAAFAATLCLQAAAFPGYTLNPDSGSSFDDPYYIESINVVFSSNVSLKSSAYATLEDEQGNVFISTEIKDFTSMQAGTYIVKFDSSELEYNGNYTLTIPAGTFTASGESNDEIVANYSMNSRYLTQPGQQKKTYDPITLISSNPVQDSVIMGLGNVAGWVNQVSFQTSNNAAVNYIGWSLYDVTDPENPVYVYQGNENRIDTNRNGSDGDYWGSSPKITIGGEAIRLMQGHTFEMKLIFAGIGYDPVSNQYPSQKDIEDSKLLETSIYFKGGMAPPVYSPYEVISVSPGDGYKIADPIFSFVMSYSGPIKPTSFTYFNGPGVSPEAGTFKAIGDVDENGCAQDWQYTFHNGILQEVEGTIMVNIKAVDAKGLTVKGSGDYDYDNNIYNVTFLCNLGADVVTLAEPTDGVVALDSVVVTNSANKKMSYMSGTATISKGGQIVRILDAPKVFNTAETMMKWSFEPITEAGSYVLNIPNAYFSIGEETNASSNNETILNLVVIGGAYYDIAITNVLPADGSSLDELYSIQLGIPSNTNIVKNANGKVAAKASLYTVSASGKESLLEDDIQGEIINNDGEQMVSFVFNTTYSEVGQYRIKVEKALFGDAEFEENNGGSGHASAEISFDYFIGNPGGGDSPSTNGSEYIVNFNDPIDMTTDNWIIDSGWRRIFGWFEDSELYPEMGSFEHRVEYKHNIAGGKYDSGYLTCGNQNYKDNSMWYDPVHVNDMFVTPDVKGKISVWARAPKLQTWLSTSAKIRIFEINEDGSKGQLLKELTTDDFGSPSEDPEWEEVVLIDPETDSYANDFKQYGLSFSNMDIDDLTAAEKYDISTSVRPEFVPVISEDDAIYTLTGIRVKNPGKGIFIMNGKKIIIK